MLHCYPDIGENSAMLTKDYSACGITQKIFSRLTKLHTSKVNRRVIAGKWEPLDKRAIRNIRYSISDLRELSREIGDLVRARPSVWAFYNFKGGVGKTTLCYEIAAHLAFMGYSVLAVDADPQGHLSTAFSVNTSADFPTLYDVVVHDLSPSDCVKNIFPGLDLLPSNLSLTRLEAELDNMPRREERVAISLASQKKKYDFIIFDCNPTISKLNMNIINFTNLLPIVVETQLFALNGLKLLLHDLEKFCRRMLIDVPEIVVLPNKYEERTVSSGEAISLLRKHFGNYLIPNFAIRMSEEFKTSTKLCMPLALFCRSNSIAFDDTIEALHYLLQKNQRLTYTNKRKYAAAY